MGAALMPASLELTRPTYSSMNLRRLPAATICVGLAMSRGMADSSRALAVGQFTNSGENLVDVEDAPRFLQVWLQSGEGDSRGAAGAQEFESGSAGGAERGAFRARACVRGIGRR